MKKYAQRLKELREYYGMTQAEVAECLNFSSAAISNYECGVRAPGIEELILLADFFYVSLDYLVGRMGNLSKREKIIRYSVIDTLKVSDSLNMKEVDTMIRILAKGKDYSWSAEKGK